MSHVLGVMVPWQASCPTTLRLNERFLELSETYRQLQQAYALLHEQREWFERTLLV